MGCLPRSFFALRKRTGTEWKSVLGLFLSGWIFLFSAGGASAQPQKYGGISGYVVDRPSGEPLIGANVAVLGAALGAATNKYGYFVIAHLPPGIYRLQVAYIGYRTDTVGVDVSAGRFQTIRVALMPAPVELEGVKITANAYAEEEKNISTVSMPVSRLRNIPSLAESDLLRALQLLPGVQAANELSSGLYIRGGSPDQNLILLDDITVYNPSHFFGFFSTFNPDAIKDIKLIKGGYPAEYGGRLSAVLDITNKDGNRQRFDGRGALSLISSKLLLEGPLPHGSYMISGRRTYLDLLLSLSGLRDLPNYYFYDFNGKINLDLNRNDRLVLSAYLGRDLLHFARKEKGRTVSTIGIGWGNRVVSAKWIHLFGPQLFGTLLLAGSTFHSLIDARASGFPVNFDNRIRDYTVKMNLEWMGARRHFFKSGFWFTSYRFFNSLKIGEHTGFENRLTEEPVYVALYAQDEWKPSPLWDVLAGIRLNGFSTGRHARIDPRLQIRRKLTPDLTAKLAAGTYSQYTTVVVNDVASFADLWYPIDDTISPLRSQQLILGLNWNHRGTYTLSLEAYMKPMQNVVEFRRRQDTNRNKLNEIFYVGRGLARGAELFLQKHRGRWTGWIGYTWSRTTHTFAELNGGRPFPVKWDFTHDLTATFSWTLGKGWTAGATFVYKSGITYTVPTGRYRLGPPDMPIEYVRAGKKNGARLEPYHRLDLFLSRRWRLVGVRGRLNLSIFNVYNHRNVWYRDYDFGTGAGQPRITDIRLLPVLPTLEVTFHF